MAVYLSYGGHEIAILNYDKGIENIEVKLVPIYNDSNSLSVPFNELQEALDQAKQLLEKCAKEDRS